jgi:hypothetical protein
VISRLHRGSHDSVRQTPQSFETTVLDIPQMTSRPHGGSSGHRISNLCDHPRSSATGLILLPRSSSLPAMPHLPHAHYETSKRDSPNETMIKVVELPKCPGFEFKPQQVNKSSQSNIGIGHLVSQI